MFRKPQKTEAAAQSVGAGHRNGIPKRILVPRGFRLQQLTTKITPLPHTPRRSTHTPPSTDTSLPKLARTNNVQPCRSKGMRQPSKAFDSQSHLLILRPRALSCPLLCLRSSTATGKPRCHQGKQDQRHRITSKARRGFPCATFRQELS